MELDLSVEEVRHSRASSDVERVRVAGPADSELAGSHASLACGGGGGGNHS
eukprot:m.164980 g.164980  ORF g.164980 m.164980 type:complete len:51 (+) comp21068_c5_seq2:185-337(+)